MLKYSMGAGVIAGQGRIEEPQERVPGWVEEQKKRFAEMAVGKLAVEQ